MDGQEVTRVRRMSMLAFGLAAIVGLVGCSTVSQTENNGRWDETASSEGVTEARDIVAAAMAVPTFDANLPPVDLSTFAGKKVFIIPSNSAIPVAESVSTQIGSLVEEHGGEWTVFTSKGTPTDWTAGIDQAISAGADVIVMVQGVVPDLIIPALQNAKNAGIPVVVTEWPEVSEQTRPLLAATTNSDYLGAAALMANWVVGDSNGEANILVLASPEIPPSAAMVNVFTTRIEEICEECVVAVTEVPAPQWAQKIPGEVQSKLQASPDTKYIVPLFDGMAMFAASGAATAGHSSDVRIASYNGTPAVLKQIQDGTPVAMIVGASEEWMGYVGFDQVARVVTGAEPLSIAQTTVPLRVFVKDNVDEAGTPPTPSTGYGDAYITAFRELWG